MVSNISQGMALLDFSRHMLAHLAEDTPDTDKLEYIADVRADLLSIRRGFVGLLSPVQEDSGSS